MKELILAILNFYDNVRKDTEDLTYPYKNIDILIHVIIAIDVFFLFFVVVLGMEGVIKIWAFTGVVLLSYITAVMIPKFLKILSRRKDNNHDTISTLVSVILLIVVFYLFIPIMGEKVSINDLEHYIETYQLDSYCTEYTSTEKIINLLKVCVWVILFFGAAILPDFFINKKKEQ
ncbi:hypothetical protein IF568_004360 [Salmonella enterica]|nr:hypothetical protein [Salmonella enterica]EBU3941478.1 hypothetical protein [Salmonella enterica subsp. enterica serovar Cerro]ELF0034285.1 hypothetical protein [Salmonella enterica subsp. enterica serovar Infantis]EFU2510932.1 hypothetical protein [Salmonella enterica]EGI1748268.1 hypothetical protein [Salmonella enterica]